MRCITWRVAPTQQPCWRRWHAPRPTAPPGTTCKRSCANAHQSGGRRRRRRARTWRRWSAHSRWRRRCRWTRPSLNARRGGCGRSTATRSGRSGASRLGWAHLRCPTSLSARLRWTRCEVCRRRPRHPLASLAHRRHACPACAADPVVASDGHSYERSAILSVLRDGNGLSPLTREPLQPNVLIQNRNLKRRMQEHEEDILRVAATAVANASDGAQQPGPAAGGGGPSSEPAPKRSRRAR